MSENNFYHIQTKQDFMSYLAQIGSCLKHVEELYKEGKQDKDVLLHLITRLEADREELIQYAIKKIW